MPGQGPSSSSSGSNRPAAVQKRKLDQNDDPSTSSQPGTSSPIPEYAKQYYAKRAQINEAFARRFDNHKNGKTESVDVLKARFISSHLHTIPQSDKETLKNGFLRHPRNYEAFEIATISAQQPTEIVKEFFRREKESANNRKFESGMARVTTFTSPFFLPPKPKEIKEETPKSKKSMANTPKPKSAKTSDNTPRSRCDGTLRSFFKPSTPREFREETPYCPPTLRSETRPFSASAKSVRTFQITPRNQKKPSYEEREDSDDSDSDSDSPAPKSQNHKTRSFNETTSSARSLRFETRNQMKKIYAEESDSEDSDSDDSSSKPNDAKKKVLNCPGKAFPSKGTTSSARSMRNEKRNQIERKYAEESDSSDSDSDASDSDASDSDASDRDVPQKESNMQTPNVPKKKNAPKTSTRASSNQRGRPSKRPDDAAPPRQRSPSLEIIDVVDETQRVTQPIPRPIKCESIESVGTTCTGPNRPVIIKQEHLYAHGQPFNGYNGYGNGYQNQMQYPHGRPDVQKFKPESRDLILPTDRSSDWSTWEPEHCREWALKFVKEPVHREYIEKTDLNSDVLEAISTQEGEYNIIGMDKMLWFQIRSRFNKVMNDFNGFN